MEPELTSFSQLLSDYPSINKGLKKSGITTPSDLQQQLLSIPNQLENVIITAPDESGKRLALLLLSIRRFFNEEEGVLLLISHSKNLSQQLFSLASLMCKIPTFNLFMEKSTSSDKKYILIGSPLQLCSFSKDVKDKVVQVSIFQADFLFGFGYGQSLHLLASSLPSSTVYQVICCQMGQEVEQFKSKWMSKVAKINYRLPESEVVKNEKVDSQAVHFYQVGEKQLIPISLYVTLKFGLVNPKVLILVQNLREVYRYYLFLERVQISSIGLYNHENPRDLKFYCLSLWMNGPTNIMISTAALYEDLQNQIFAQKSGKVLKNKELELNNLATVICLNLKMLPPQQIFNNFVLKPFLMTFVENTEEEIGKLHELINYCNQNFSSVKTKEYPISKKELSLFKYRINDVFMNIGNHKVENFQKLDFKKKMLKSPDLKDYFVEHPQEKSTLIQSIHQLKKQIDQEAVTISSYVPLYLVPQSLRPSYEEKLKQVEKEHANEDGPEYLKKARKAVKRVEIEDEDPEHTDISRLKLISSRKRWKLQHGFKLKKRNKRNEKKGIFQS